MAGSREEEMGEEYEIIEMETHEEDTGDCLLKQGEGNIGL